MIFGKPKWLSVLIRLVVILNLFFTGCVDAKQNDEAERPNILILMSDNHCFKHLGCYGDPVVKTPNIDRIASEGVIFNHAYCQAPSCAPARAAMITGQEVWQLREGANLWGSFPSDLADYPGLLENAGYVVGIEGKGWGPGNFEVSGWKRNPGGVEYNSLEDFFDKIEKGKPWCYWFSSWNPHRPYQMDETEKLNFDLTKIKVPGCLPEVEDVKRDITEYYGEVQNFDREVGHYLAFLSKIDQLDNTVVVICSDNGWQMPRGLANLYDHGTRIPLIISWPGQFLKSRRIDDFVLLNDLAPTFLELAGVKIPKTMTAKSLLPILTSKKSGITGKGRDFIVTARERHAFVRKGGLGYPARAIRTKDYLYIHNYEPDRWPAGDPPLYGDVDAPMLQYPCHTKMYMLFNKDRKEVAPLFKLAFGKRPAEELFDLEADPEQIVNVADLPEYRQIKSELAQKLRSYLKKYEDPRESDIYFDFDKTEYYKDADKKPKPGDEAIRLLGLKKEYNYLE